jgi:glucan 1,3-beta-glucosidase
MPLLNHLLSLVVLGISVVPSVLSFQPGFNYGSEKVRGVNLGGWLVLEVKNPYPYVL